MSWSEDLRYAVWPWRYRKASAWSTINVLTARVASTEHYSVSAGIRGIVHRCPERTNHPGLNATCY